MFDRLPVLRSSRIVTRSPRSTRRIGQVRPDETCAPCYDVMQAKPPRSAGCGMSGQENGDGSRQPSPARGRDAYRPDPPDFKRGTLLADGAGEPSHSVGDHRGLRDPGGADRARRLASQPERSPRRDHHRRQRRLRGPAGARARRARGRPHRAPGTESRLRRRLQPRLAAGRRRGAAAAQRRRRADDRAATRRSASGCTATPTSASSARGSTPAAGCRPRPAPSRACAPACSAGGRC